MNRSTLRVVIADDHHLFRDGLALLLERSGRIEVVGQASSTDAVLPVVGGSEPDVLLLDVEIDHVPAESTIRRLRRHAPEVRVVVLTMHGDPVLERQLRSAGAADYVTKDASAEVLVDRICSVRRVPTERIDGSTPKPSRAGLLTEREQQVLRMIGLAQTNKAIGVALSIAEGTVKRHVVHIFAKLGATSRIDAVRKARILGEM